MKKISYLQAIHEAVEEEMVRDPKVFVIGEDVRAWGAPLGEFKGLYKKYPEQVLDTPISERAILGSSIGAALMGMRPIASIMFNEFLSVCWAELANTCSKTLYMTGGKATLPITIMSYGGAGVGAAAEHSSCWDGMLMGIPGIKVVSASTPYDAKGLLKSSIRDNNPVVFLYHKKLIFSRYQDEVPEEEYLVPIGKADIKKKGKDVTVVASGLMVHRALAVAKKLEVKGISIEVLDPRSWRPFDKETLLESVKKTSRLVIMDEAPKMGGAASEVSAIVAEDGFKYLKAPIKRVSSADSPVPFSPPLEKAWMPDEEDLIKAVNEIL